ncbi:MAG: DUF2283 domain-containing protein [Methylobacter sp.]|nr:DUF2283 domain-containing protein [Methylobacter sp.]
MKIKYFEDTDMALLEFSEHPVFETKEINEVSFQQINRQVA